MNRSTRSLLVLTCLTGVLGILTSPAKAQNAITFAFTGIVTSVDDTNNFFNDTYVLGAAISGSYTFSDSGYTNGFFLADPNVHRYDNFQHNNLTINAGARQVQSGTSSFINSLAITVANDANGMAGSSGDTYRVQSLLELPSFFRDPSGDPSFDPDGNYLTYTVGFLDLYDPTGTALSSFNLPLTPPNLSLFSQRTGSLLIFDGNGEFPDAPRMNFSISTLQVAPEPTSLAFAWLGLVGLGIVRRRFPLKGHTTL